MDKTELYNRGIKMEKFLVVNVSENRYTLRNVETTKEFKVKFTFFDLEQPIKRGDMISLHAELLDPKYSEYSKHYYFGAKDKVYGRNVTSKDDIDVMGIYSNGKSIALKRFFG